MRKNQAVVNTPAEEIKPKEEKKHLELNLDLGRQDLNDNFRKIQEAINNSK